MARTYKKADELKEKILAVAGRYFKEYGYEKTTFHMIAEELSISKASISYHFKSKPSILFYLFGRSMEAIDRFVRENMDDSFNAYRIHCVSHIYFYRKIMSWENNWRLFYHLDHRALWVNEQLHIVEGYFKDIINDFKKNFTDQDVRIMAVMSLGGKLSLFNDFVKENVNGNVAVDKHCYYMVYLVGMLCQLDEATIEKNIQSAFEFANSHTLPPDAFLV